MHVVHNTFGRLITYFMRQTSNHTSTELLHSQRIIVFTHRKIDFFEISNFFDFPIFRRSQMRGLAVWVKWNIDVGKLSFSEFDLFMLQYCHHIFKRTSWKCEIFATSSIDDQYQHKQLVAYQHRNSPLNIPSRLHSHAALASCSRLNDRLACKILLKNDLKLQYGPMCLFFPQRNYADPCSTPIHSDVERDFLMYVRRDVSTSTCKKTQIRMYSSFQFLILTITWTILSSTRVGLAINQ